MTTRYDVLREAIIEVCEQHIHAHEFSEESLLQVIDEFLDVLSVNVPNLDKKARK